MLLLSVGPPSQLGEAGDLSEAGDPRRPTENLRQFFYAFHQGTQTQQLVLHSRDLINLIIV